MHSSEYANFITRQFVALVFRLLVEWQYQKKAVKSLHSKFQFKNDQFLIEVTDFIYLFLLTFPLKVASLNDDTFVRSFYFLIINGSLSLSHFVFLCLFANQLFLANYECQRLFVLIVPLNIRSLIEQYKLSDDWFWIKMEKKKNISFWW